MSMKSLAVGKKAVAAAGVPYRGAPIASCPILADFEEA
ncbi:hypothetical protein BSIN_3039 [Burkholderia singularis]|uniref:Uncharacterized protein n=1 Tax=Burkholderia singularis TaxID=1503053 RepID=A0A238H3P0_9BURK|nr:hypothetical protein BSIN_3039 [Burkholderia singularis]